MTKIEEKSNQEYVDRINGVLNDIPQCSYRLRLNDKPVYIEVITLKGHDRGLLMYFGGRKGIIVGEEKVKLKLRDLYYKVNHIDTSEEYYNFQRNELGIK